MSTYKTMTHNIIREWTHPCLEKCTESRGCNPNCMLSCRDQGSTSCYGQQCGLTPMATWERLAEGDTSPVLSREAYHKPEKEIRMLPITTMYGIMFEKGCTALIADSVEELEIKASKYGLLSNRGMIVSVWPLYEY